MRAAAWPSTAKYTVASAAKPTITAARPNANLRGPRARSNSGSHGAAAIARAGTAGSTYSPRLPVLSVKNSTTIATHASSTATSVSRLRSAARQRGHNHGTSAISGSQNSGMILPK